VRIGPLEGAMKRKKSSPKPRKRLVRYYYLLGVHAEIEKGKLWIRGNRQIHLSYNQLWNRYVTNDGKEIEIPVVQ
jgi:hypothetical protein